MSKKEIASSSVTQVSASDLRQILIDHYKMPIEKYIPPFITGSPGLGKTTIVVETAKSLNTNCHVVRPIQHESVEFTGVPAVDHNNFESNARWAPFGELLPTDKDWEGFIPMDEITQLDVTQQKIIAGLIDKEGVAGRRLPRNSRLVFMGNRTQDRAGSTRMLTIIEDRTVQYELTFSVEDWIKWASDAGISEVVTSFARFKGGQFVSFDPSCSFNPTPRSWEKVDSVIKYMGASATLAIRGLVGGGMGTEFISYRERFDLLHGSIEKIIKTGKINQSIDKIDVQHALVGALTQYIKEHPEIVEKDLNNIVKFAVGNLPAGMAGLFALRVFMEAPTRMASNTELRKWMNDNKEALAQWAGK